MFDRIVGEVVSFDKGGHVGVERTKSLGAGPLILQRAQKVDDLSDGRGEVLGGARLHLPGDAVKSFLQKRAQRPACAISCEQVQVMNVEGAGAVSVADLGGVDIVQPVIGSHFSRDVENKPS